MLATRHDSAPIDPNLVRGRFVAGLALAVLACTALAYHRALGSGFVSDDYHIIESVVRRGPFGIWSSHQSNFFRPVFSLSLYLDHALWGLDPRGYHLVNLLLHVWNACLVGILSFVTAGAAGIGRDRSETAGLAAGLLFAVLPSHAEPVYWISCRGDLLACSFSLSSILSIVLYLRGGGSRWLAVSLAAAALAMSTKEAAITLPLLAVALALSRSRLLSGQGATARRVRAVAANAALLVLYLAVRWWVLGHLVGGYGKAVHGRLGLEEIGKIFLYFPSRMLAPSLGVVEIGGVIVPYTLFVYAGAVLLALILLARRSRLSLEMLFMAVGMMFILLLPVMNLSVRAVSSEGERFLYLPSTALVLAVATVLAAALSRRAILVATLLLTVPGLLFLHTAGDRWTKAGAHARRTVEALDEVGPAQRLWLLDVPDSLEGAYILRDGIDFALALVHGREKVHRVIPVVRRPVGPAADGLSVERLERGRYLLRPPPGVELPPCFSQITDVEAAALVLTSGEGEVLEARIALEPADAVACWSEDGLRLLDAPR